MQGAETRAGPRSGTSRSVSSLPPASSNDYESCET